MIVLCMDKDEAIIHLIILGRGAIEIHDAIENIKILQERSDNPELYDDMLTEVENDLKKLKVILEDVKENYEEESNYPTIVYNGQEF